MCLRELLPQAVCAASIATSPQPPAHDLGSCDKTPCPSRLPQRGFSFCLRLLGQACPTVVATRPLRSGCHHKPCPSQQPRRHILPPTPSPEQHGRRHNVRSRNGRPLPIRRLSAHGRAPGKGAADAWRPRDDHQGTFPARAGPRGGTADARRPPGDFHHTHANRRATRCISWDSMSGIRP